MNDSIVLLFIYNVYFTFSLSKVGWGGINVYFEKASEDESGLSDRFVLYVFFCHFSSRRKPTFCLCECSRVEN